MNIVLVAFGNPSYAHWAHNLAVSIRAYSGVKIQLITDGNFTALASHADLDRCFDQITVFQPGFPRNDEYAARYKLHHYFESIYDEYVYLDVDAVCFRDLNPLLAYLRGLGKDFQTKVNGVSTKTFDNLDASLWAKVEMIWGKYGLADSAQLPGTNSSFQYVKKGKFCDKLFTTALENLDSPIAISEQRYTWGHSKFQPDELYMNIALAKMNYVPTMREPVVYFRRRDQGGGRVSFETLIRDFYLIGCWGDKTYNHQEISGTGDRNSGWYNKLVKQAFDIFYPQKDYLFTYTFSQLINNKLYAGRTKDLLLR